MLVKHFISFHLFFLIYSVKLDAIFDLVPLYAKLADLKTGIVDYKTFSSYMQIKSNEALESFFKKFDKVRFK